MFYPDRTPKRRNYNGDLGPPSVMITPKSQSVAHEKEGGVHLLNIIHGVAVKAARKLPNGLYGETRSNNAGEKW